MLKPDCLNSSDKARVEIDATSLLDDGRLITFKLAPSNTSLQLFHNTVEYFKKLSVNAAGYLVKEERERIKEMIEDIESDFNGDIDENQLRPMEEVVQLLVDLPQRVDSLARKVEATAKEAFMRKLEQCIGSQNSKNMPRLIVNHYYISSPKVEAVFAGNPVRTPAQKAEAAEAARTTLLAEFPTLNAGATEQFAVLLLGHTLAALLND